MKLKKLKLRNFRIHRKLDLEFQDGITGVTGGNGAGKSAIIEAIRFVLQGSFDGPSKDKVISLGETSGYVSCTFELHGKEGYIERHLDCSKVILEYDGKDPLKKASEVKELWDRLMQITPDIMDNVVIARQDDIPKLFTGDASEREKLFQKIFLVPNTEKLRKVIWDDYIKKAPPAYMVANQDDLQAALAEAIRVHDEKIDRLKSLPRVEQHQYESIYSLQTLHRKQLADHQRILELEAKEAALEPQIAPVQAKRDELKGRLVTIDIGLYRQKVVELSTAQEASKSRGRIIADLNRITVDLLPEDDYQELLVKAGEAKTRWDKLQAEHTAVTLKYDQARRELAVHQNLKGHAVCPTCKQSIKDIADFIASHEKQMAEIAGQINSAPLQEAATHCGSLNKKIETQNNLRIQIGLLEQSLVGCPEVQFDPKMLDVARQVVAAYDQMDRELRGSEQTYTYLVQQRDTLAGQKVGLDKLQDPQSVHAKLNELDAAHQRLNEASNSYKTAETEVGAAASLVGVARQRITDNDAIKAKNVKRDQYVQDLGEVYEALHTSEFPRKLIQNYAGIVTEYLNRHLDSFVIDYTAQVNDNFGIDVLDTSGRILPTVSGGQRVIIGLSLRLALHDLFGQGFPMMIIDEASAALHEDNKQAYFDVVKSLKDNAKLKQVIVIDHDDRLANVVDNLIAL